MTGLGCDERDCKMTDEELQAIRSVVSYIRIATTAERLLARCMQKIHNLSTWTPCSERMPTLAKGVLVCSVCRDDTEAISIMRWMPGRKCWDSWNGVDWIQGLSARRVTHWRDIPSTPESFSVMPDAIRLPSEAYD